MDTNLILSIVILITLLLVAIEWDESFLLFMVGFLSIALCINIDLAFGIYNSTYQGFGQMIQLLYAAVSIFAFTKTYFTAKEHGFSIQGAHNGK